MLIKIILSLFLICSLLFAYTAMAQRLNEPNFPTKVQSLGQADYNWTLKTLDGQEVKLEQFRGKVIFLNLWATWCGPCMMEMSSLQKLYDRMKDKVVFIFASDENLEMAKQFIDQKGFDMPVYIYESGPPSAYNTFGIPTTFIISADGQVVYEHIGAADWGTQASVDFLRKVLEHEKYILNVERQRNPLVCLYSYIHYTKGFVAFLGIIHQAPIVRFSDPITEIENISKL